MNASDKNFFPKMKLLGNNSKALRSNERFFFLISIIIYLTYSVNNFHLQVHIHIIILLNI